jgi:hypothetical protein
MRLIVVLLLVITPMTHADTGLIFPSNADSGSDDNAHSPRFRWLFTPSNPELPIWGPGGQGVTYIWNYYPYQQSGYYTTFFWANDDGVGTLNSTWFWDGGDPGVYYGAHPWPCGIDSNLSGTCLQGGGSDEPTHWWEIAADGVDWATHQLVPGQWYTQALVVWEDGSGYKHHEFYWDLPNLDSSHMFSHTSSPSWGNWSPGNPPAPALNWGDAPWQPGREIGYGIHRGIRIYNNRLSEADILTEAASPLSTSAGMASIWYLNMNPTPTDISDKSGKGHHPAWVSSVRPALWEFAGPSVPDSPRNFRAR